MEDISICNVFQKTLAFMRPQFKKRETKITFKCAGKPAWLIVDFDKLQQVFINLIKNALEAMDRTNFDDRYLIIELKLENDNKKIKGQTNRVNKVIINFIDNGPGIPDSIIDKLFSPFATTKTSGTGLGLPVNMQIIQNFGGYLKAQNNFFGGACFQIELPIKFIEQERPICYQEQKPYCERVADYGSPSCESCN